MSLCRIFGPPLLKWYFDDPRKPIKTHVYCYTRILSKYPCGHPTCSIVSRVHREMCIKIKTFGVFLNEYWITWLLAFHMPGNALTRPSIVYWRAIYWASWMHWRRRILESKETIVHCCLTSLCLSMHPFVHLEHTLLLFSSFPLLCKLAIEMEDWSGGGLGRGLCFSVSMRCR